MEPIVKTYLCGHCYNLFSKLVESPFWKHSL